MNRLDWLNVAKSAVPNLLLGGPAMLAVNALMPPASETGEHVAEVWLTWFFGRGTTLYRQRFTTPEEAEAAVKAQAVVLDSLLPKYYRDTNYLGQPIWLEHEYGISYGVRKLAEEETTDFIALNKTTLPGYN